MLTLKYVTVSFLTGVLRLNYWFSWTGSHERSQIQVNVERLQQSLQIQYPCSAAETKETLRFWSCVQVQKRQFLKRTSVRKNLEGITKRVKVWQIAQRPLMILYWRQRANTSCLARKAWERAKGSQAPGCQRLLTARRKPSKSWRYLQKTYFF